MPRGRRRSGSIAIGRVVHRRRCARLLSQNVIIEYSSVDQLSTANAGLNRNGSQFYITTAAAPHLDGRHVVFGKVLSGMSTIETIEALPTNAQDRPLADVRIHDCAQLID